MPDYLNVMLLISEQVALQSIEAVSYLIFHAIDTENTLIQKILGSKELNKFQFQVKVHDLPGGTAASGRGNNALRFFDSHQLKVILVWFSFAILYECGIAIRVLVTYFYIFNIAGHNSFSAKLRNCLSAHTSQCNIGPSQ